MCGICGFIGNGDENLLRRMCDSLVHRGPDSAGYYARPPVHMGMRRLSIIDLPDGGQPIYNEDKTIAITFNGEIYNYRELRGQLVEKGHRFTTHSDTETIVHLFEDLREKCVDHLQGMFAFSIWDDRRKELFLARDRLGKKPLYLMETPDRFAWASELKGLSLLPGFSRDIDPVALNQYLQFLYVPCPRTIYRCCRKLRPGHWLKWNSERVEEKAWWEPSGTLRNDITVEEAKEEIRSLLKTSVQRRMVADVDVGAFLSGGLDSASIVAFMSELSDRPVKTFTMGYESKHATYNEWDKAKIVARAFGTDHHEFEVNPDLDQTLPKIAAAFDEPFADSSCIPTYLVSQQTSRQVKVALSGVGGDEALGGYPRYLGALISERYANWPSGLRRVLSMASGFIPETPTATNYGGRVKRFLKAGTQGPFERYKAWISYTSISSRKNLVANGLLESADEEHKRFWDRSPYEDYGRRIQYLDTFTYLTDDLLCMADRMSMAHSLELRAPFCDHELVDFTLSLPPAMKMKGFTLKSLFKDSMKGILPAELLSARKQGFMVPLASWLNGEWRGMTESVLQPERVKKAGLLNPEAVAENLRDFQSGKSGLSHRIYSLLVLQMWMEAGGS